MSNIHTLHPQWVDKATMAKRLGVNPRTVYRMWKREELLRREIDGVVLWSLPPEDTMTGQGDTCGTSFVHAAEDTPEDQRTPNQRTPLSSGLGSVPGVLPELQVLREEREVWLVERAILVERMRAASASSKQLSAISSELEEVKLALVEARTALSYVERERDALRRVVETRSFGWWKWFKNLLERWSA